MTEITHELAAILSTVPCHGNYYASGSAEIAMPALEVDGVGRISLPLLPVQAEQLIAVATRSPYGRGEATLLDTTVRKTWQIPSEQVRLSGRGWPGALASIVARVAGGLGVTGPVSAELYKLLIYDAGSFFVEHRDTEKSSGMFATLVLVLPSLCSGGELIVRHQGQEVCLDLNGSEPSDVAFAAFYADCVHEVRPVTEGYRLTLIYNLLREDGEGRPTFQAHTEQSEAIATLLGEWARNKDEADDDTPEKLIYPLEHAYTPAELAFDALKNADAAAAAILIPAARAADCELHLALVSIEESGSAEHDYVPRRRGRWYGDYDDGGRDEDFEIGEIFERDLSLAHWRTADGAHAAFGALPFLEDELCPPDAFEDMEPDEQHFHEATGNEGASFERSYQRAALVLWPRARKLAVLNQAGLGVTLPYLADLTGRWAKSGAGKASALWREAHTLSGHMLAQWPARQGYPGAEQGDREASILTCLTQLDDVERIDDFLSTVSAEGRYAGGENAALVESLILLPLQRSAELVEQVVLRNAYLMPGACANLLARVADLPQFLGAPTLLHPALLALTETLLGARVNTYPVQLWQHPIPIDPALVDDLVYALARIDARTLAARFVEYALGNPAKFGLDDILVPAALKLVQRAQTRQDASAERIRLTCLRHLRERINEALAPPADFTRSCALACRCVHCAELSRFLADPMRREWAFRAAEAHRRHVEASVRQGRCDLDLATRKTGSPHSLIATKNQASYERRVVQRTSDLATLARLDATQDA